MAIKDVWDVLCPIFVKASGLVIVLVLFIGIRSILAPKRKFSDFIIGDSGTYSLSRLQMVLWAYIIISAQITFLVCVAIHGLYNVASFDLIFPEQILWLLGLSSSSYLAVKTITVDKISKKSISRVSSKRWNDLIMGDNGLDFTKFQFLIWTLLALSLYIIHCNYYINDLLSAKGTELQNLLNVDYAGLPNISWSFIVLMGLSQGTYVGKKLIPTFKVDDIKADRLAELQTKINQIDEKINLKKAIIGSSNPATNAGENQIQTYKDEIVILDQEKASFQNEIGRISG